MLTYPPRIEPSTPKRLFIVCPFSQLETFLSARFGETSYFLTAAGSVLFLEPIKFTNALEDFLIREAIEEIAVVNEWSSVFIRNALNEELEPVIETAQILHKTYLQHREDILSDNTFENRCRQLAFLNSRRQLSELLKNVSIGKIIQSKNIQLKCLVVHRRQNEILITEFNKMAASNES
jgi:hypothetical protein